MLSFYIFTNSPGEVFSWVKPLVNRLHTVFNTAEIYIFLTPCQFATGEEVRVCQTFDGIRAVFPPKNTVSTLLFNQPFASGVVFHMGGDPMHAKRFSKKTNSKLVGYFETDYQDKRFDYLFFKQPNRDLMSVGLSPLPLNVRDGIVLLPGSRAEHVELALPKMVEITLGLPGVTVMLSPFTSDFLMKKYHMLYPNLNFQRLTDSNDLAPFKYALTIPGTNTMQLAILKVPYMMIFPTDDSRILRLTGLVGLCLFIPILGRILKFLILNVGVKIKRFYSLPNILLKSMVCPEIVGRFSIAKVRDQFRDFIQDKNQYDFINQQFSLISATEDPLDDMIDWLKIQVN